MKNCVFCKIIFNELPAIVIFEDKDVIAFQSGENHPLIVPKKHVKDIYELDEELGAKIMKVAVRLAKAVKKGLKPDGINLVQANEPAAHQDVFHFHLHIKPRWKGDKVVLDWDVTRIEDKIRQETVNRIKAQLF